MLQSIDCYSPNRQPRVTTTDSVYIDNFPEVEYPGSITDTIKPFYLNSNPFSSDVQASFKSLKSGGTTKPRPTIILNINASDNSKDKNKEDLSEKAITNQVKNSTARDVNSKHDNINAKPSIVLFEDDSGSEEINEEAKSREEESSIESEIEYIIGFINNEDDIIAALGEVETEFVDVTNSSMQIFDDEFSNATITSDAPSVNNFVEESNESFTNTETSLLNELINNSTATNWLENDGLTNSSDYNDTGSFIEEISNTDVL